MKKVTKDEHITTVNGIVLTPTLTDVLLTWQEWSKLDGSRPENYIQYLNRIQDFLIKMLVEFDGHGERNESMTYEIKCLLMSLVNIKDDLSKHFISYVIES